MVLWGKRPVRRLLAPAVFSIFLFAGHGEALTPPAGTVIWNTAAASCSDANGAPLPAVRASTGTVIAGGPVLTARLAAAPDPAAPGQTLTYTLTYANTGNAAASGVTAALLLPAGVLVPPVTASAAGVYDPALNKVSWSIGVVPAGASASLDITAAVAASAAGGAVFYTSASITSSEGAGASALAGVTVGEAPRLVLTVAADRAAVFPGGELAYTLTYANTGNRTATGVRLMDPVPSGTAYSPGSATGTGTFAGGMLSWGPFDLPAGAGGSAGFRVRVSTLAAAGFIVRNTPSAVSTETGLVPGGEAATAVVNPSAALTCAAAVAAVAAGNNITFTVEFTNDPLTTLTGLVLLDSLPAGTAFISADGGGIYSAGAITWTEAALAPGETRRYHVTVRVSTGTAPGAVLANSVAASAAEIAPLSASASVSVSARTAAYAGFVDGSGLEKHYFSTGETVYLRVTDADRNTAPSVIEQVPATVSDDVTGDSETVLLIETGPDTGIFQGALPGAGGAGVPGDGKISEVPDSTLTLLYTDPLDAAGVYRDTAAVDPLGVVFNSAGGTPVVGAAVTLVDAGTGLAAALTGGQLNPYTTAADGKYSFPSVPAGSYYLDVAPGPGYSYPSAVPAAELPPAFSVVTGSRRETFTLSGGTSPVALDLPADPASAALTAAMACDRAAASLGDIVEYTVTVSNPGSSIPVNTRLTNTLPHGFNFIKGSTRINGVKTADPARTPSGQLQWPLPDPTAGTSVSLSYRASPGADSQRGTGINSAFAQARSLGADIISNTASFALKINEGVFTSRGTIFGRVFLDEDGDGLQGGGEAGLPEAALYLEDGTRVNADKDGKFSMIDVPAGTHVLRLDEGSLPAGLEPAEGGSRFAGGASSQFVDIYQGGLHRADFAVIKRSPPPALSMPTDAGTPVPASSGTAVSASSGTATLEEQSAGMTPGLAFLSPEGDAILPGRVINVTLKSPAGAEVKLFLNGGEISSGKIGKVVTNRKSGVQITEYIGLELEAGATNQLRAELSDGFGNLRDSTAVTVTVPGPAAKIEIVPGAAELPADGRSRTAVSLTLLDAGGLSAAGAGVITVEVSAGGILEKDLDPAAPGVQLALKDGRAGFTLISPPEAGLAEVNVSYGDIRAATQLRFVPERRPLMGVGVAEFRTGYGSKGGNTSLLSGRAQRESGYASSGRAAFFTKGSLWKDLTLTASYDSDKETGKELMRASYKDPEAEERYPVYGDESKLGYETYSSGKLFARLDWRRSSLLAGDFDTGFSDTKLGAYRRSFNGLKLDAETDKLKISAFETYSDYTQVVDALPGKGISGLYYLSATPLVEGSEKVVIETRDRQDPSRVLKREPRARYTDYTVDYPGGSLLFKDAVPAFGADLNPVYIIVSYESRGSGRRQYTYGARAAAKISRRLELGATSVTQESAAGNYLLTAADASLKLPLGTVLKGEYAATRSLFDLDSVLTLKQGEAKTFSLESAPAAKLGLSASYGDTGKFFNNPSAFEALRGEEKYQAAARYQLSPDLTLKGKYYHAADHLNGGDRRTESLALEKRVKRTTLDLEAADETSSLPFIPAGAAGSRFPFDFRDDYPKRLTSGKAGLNTPLGGGLTLTAEHRRDLRQDQYAVSQAGLDYQLAGFSKLYLREVHERSGDRRELRTALGAESAVGRNTAVFDEYRLENGADGASVQQSIGLRNKLALSRTVTANISVEDLRTLSGVKRQSEPGAFASALGLEYLPDDKWKVTSRAEYRAQTAAKSYLGELCLGFSPGSGLAFLLRSRGFYEDMTSAGNRFTLRSTAGLSYRPASQDKLDLLGKLEHQYRRNRLSGQDLATNSYIASVEPSLRATRKLTLTGRYAGKWTAEERTKIYTSLAAARAVYDLARRFDLGAEYRVLLARGGGRAEGGYAEGGYNPLAGLWLSTGYSFDRFDPDLAGDGYWGRGPYFRLRFKFDENLGAGRPMN